MTLRRRFSAAILIVLSVAVLTAVVLTTLVPTSGAASSPKISARVINETAKGNATETVIVLYQQADLTAAAALPTKVAEGRYVVNSLRGIANRTRAPINA